MTSLLCIAPDGSLELWDERPEFWNGNEFWQWGIENGDDSNDWVYILRPDRRGCPEYYGREIIEEWRTP